MSNLPMYVSQRGHGEQVVLPPGDVQGARCYAFVLDGDHAKMNAFVARFLSAPTGGEWEFRVVGWNVFLTFLDAQRLTSTAEVTGYVRDRECALWVMLAAKKRGWLQPERLVFWMPYVFVDTSIAMATGREVWGFSKEMANLTVPTQPGDAARFVAEATLFKTFSQQTQGQVAPIIEVVRDGKLGVLASAWQTGKAAFDEILAGLGGKGGRLDVKNWEGDVTLAVDAAKLLFTRDVPLVNLKQFRDAEDPTRACYQALVEGPCHLEKLNGGGLLLGDYKATFTECASHQIVQDLGLAGNSVPVRFAFWVDMQFGIPPGTELWRAV